MDDAPGDAQRLTVLAPIEPASAANGLAMRTELFCRAASRGFEVRVVVIPVAGRLPEGVSVRGDVVRVRPDPAQARAGVRALVADPVWRHRLAAAATLPTRARQASPGLADAVAESVGRGRCVGLHIMRSYLAPLGAAVADRLHPSWVSLDLDEDDAGLAAALDEPEEAAAYDRLLTVFGSLFDGLSAASAPEAERLGKRHGLAVEHLPNAVDVPAQPDRLQARAAPRQSSMLFVANLTYPPNRRAAHVLATEVLPEVDARMDQRVHLVLVGPGDSELQSLAGPQVQVRGFVPDLGPIYAAADVVVAPLGSGAGTRIKLLEAFAHRVPVVASPVAAAGLAVAGERHLLLAEGASETAAAVERILRDAALAGRLSRRAHALVKERYSTDIVMSAISGMFDRAAARGPERLRAAG